MNATIDRLTPESLREKPAKLSGPDQLFETSKWLVKRTQFQEALEKFSLLIEKYPTYFPDVMVYLYKRILSFPDDIPLRILVANLYVHSQGFGEAVSELEEIFDLSPEESQIYLILGKIYNKNGQKKRIKSLFEAAVDQDIFDSAILDLLPKIYLEENRVQDSINLYKRLIIKDPESVHHIKVLGELYFRNREYSNAAKCIKHAFDLSPTISEEAIKFCENLLKFVPKDSDILFVLADLYFKSRQPLNAVNHLKVIIQYHEDKIPQVITHFKEALGVYPDAPDLLLALAEATIMSGDYTEGVSYLRVIFDMNVDEDHTLIALLKKITKEYHLQISALLLLADIYIKQKDFHLALDQMEQLLKSELEDFSIIEDKIDTCLSKDPEILIHAHYIQAKILFFHKDYKRCINQVNTLFNTGIDIKARLLAVACYDKMNQLPKAINTLFDGLKRDPHHWDLHSLLFSLQTKVLTIHIHAKKDLQSKDDIPLKWHYEQALLHLRKGEIRKAIELFQYLSDEEGPLKIRSQLLIGRCFLEFGRYDLASNHIRKTLTTMEDEDQTLAIQARYLAGISHICANKLSKAMEYLESILQFDINFRGASDLTEHYKKQSFNNLQGLTVTGVLSLGEEITVSPIGILNMESERAYSKKAPQQTMSFAHTHNNQGVDYVFQQNLKTAEDEFNIAIQMDPYLTSAFTNAALVALLRGQYDTTQSLLKRAHKSNPKFDLIFVTKGLFYTLHNRLNEAKEAFNYALRLNPKNEVAMLNLGDVCYLQKDMEGAFEYWELASKSAHLFFLIQRRMQYLNRDSMSFADWVVSHRSFFKVLQSDD